jgi:hypothetical protein
MAYLKQQQISIRYSFKVGRNAAGTSEMLKVAFGEQTLGRTQVVEWFS